MGFTRTVEAGDPHSWLLGGTEIVQECLQNLLQPLFVLPITDEGFKFVSEDFLCRLAVIFRNLRYPVVGKAIDERILLVDFLVFHA